MIVESESTYLTIDDDGSKWWTSIPQFRFGKYGKHRPMRQYKRRRLCYRNDGSKYIKVNK